MEDAELLAKLKDLLEKRSIIDKLGPLSDESQQWLATVKAHLELVDPRIAAQFAHYTRFIVMPLSGSTLVPLWMSMQHLLRSAIARLEIATAKPGNLKSKVYGPGEAYDVYRDLGQIMKEAKNEVFIIDPYANEEVFELYLEKILPGIKIRLLSGKPTQAIKSVAGKFKSRPGIIFEAKMTSDAHDRVIFVDSTDCWVLGQSIKDAALKKPTYLLPVDAVKDMATLYEDLWQKAAPY